MTRAEKLYEKKKGDGNDSLRFMYKACPGDCYNLGPVRGDEECERVDEDCFLCWMSEYKEENG